MEQQGRFDFDRDIAAGISDDLLYGYTEGASGLCQHYSGGQQSVGRRDGYVRGSSCSDRAFQTDQGQQIYSDHRTYDLCIYFCMQYGCPDLLLYLYCRSRRSTYVPRAFETVCRVT